MNIFETIITPIWITFISLALISFLIGSAMGILLWLFLKMQTKYKRDNFRKYEDIQLKLCELGGGALLYGVYGTIGIIIIYGLFVLDMETIKNIFLNIVTRGRQGEL